MSLCTCEHIDCRCIDWDSTHHNACPVLAGSLSLAPLQDFFFFFFFFFLFFCFVFVLKLWTWPVRSCVIPLISWFPFKGASLRIYLSSLSHQFCCFTIGLGPVTVRVPLVVNLQKALCLLGFMYCISFIFSIDRVDTYLKGNGGHVRVSVDGQTLATDQPIRRAGVSNCTIIFCHDLEEAFI